MANNTRTCPRCNRSFHRYYDNMRFRFGTFTEEKLDGVVDRFEKLCEDCHRDVVRS